MQSELRIKNNQTKVSECLEFHFFFAISLERQSFRELKRKVLSIGLINEEQGLPSLGA